MTSKIKVQRSSTTGDEPSTTSAADYGEISVNLADKKVFMRDSVGAAQMVGQLVTDYDDTQLYRAGDLSISNDIIYQALGDTTIGPFTPGEWKQIGSVDPINAIVINPATLERNKISVNGAIKGLVIEAGSSQTERLVDIPGVQTGDDVGAYIDSLSFPQGHFAPNVFRAVQVGHSFAAQGELVAFEAGSGFIPAPLGSGSLIGVIESIIDANTLVIRTSGKTTALQPAAFEGGAVSVGTLYYASTTTPGKLSSVLNNNPVLVTTDPVNEGVVLPGATGPVQSDEFVKVTGDTMTGSLTMDGTSVLFDDSQMLITRDASDYLSFTVDGFSAAHIEPRGNSAGSLRTVMTRQKGDTRYGQLGVDNRWLGDQTIESVSPELTLLDTNSAVQEGARWALQILGDGRLRFRSGELDDTFVDNQYIDPTSNDPAVDGNSLMSRAKGDLRWLKIADTPPAFGKKVEYGPITWSPLTRAVVPHNEGAKPSIMSLVVRITTAQDGFTIGEEVVVGSVAGAGSGGPGQLYNATLSANNNNFYVTVGTLGVVGVSAQVNDIVVIDPANFNMFIKAIF